MRAEFLTALQLSLSTRDGEPFFTLTRVRLSGADVVILASLPIAGCTLAADAVAGSADRKRPFTALVSIRTGFAASAMFASVQLQHPLVAPDAACYLISAGGITASLGIIAATFPLLARITGPEVARNEWPLKPVSAAGCMPSRPPVRAAVPHNGSGRPGACR
jgi:hypothetical protein